MSDDQIQPAARYRFTFAMTGVGAPGDITAVQGILSVVRTQLENAGMEILGVEVDMEPEPESP